MTTISNSRIWRVIPLLIIVVLFCPFACGKVIYVDDDAARIYQGSSWTDAYPCLQNALTVAQPGDEIRVAQGTYQPDRQLTARSLQLVASGNRTESFHLKNGVTLKGGFAGFGEPYPDARDIEVYETILSGDLKGNDVPNFVNNVENSYKVVIGSGTDATAVLDGFTIIGGSRGGGMHNSEGNPTLINCTFRGNYANDDGGGMYNRKSSPMLINCTFAENYTPSDGGGIRNKDSAHPTLINCVFRGNSAGGKGGGLDNSNAHPNNLPSNAVLISFCCRNDFT